MPGLAIAPVLDVVIVRRASNSEARARLKLAQGGSWSKPENAAPSANLIVDCFWWGERPREP